MEVLLNNIVASSSGDQAAAILHLDRRTIQRRCKVLGFSASNTSRGRRLLLSAEQLEVIAKYGRHNGPFRSRGINRRTYKSWNGMVRRCTNPRHRSYAYYGGRGISICERWLNSFENFLADMGIRPDHLTLDRIDNDGNYEPGNCRWATKSQQVRNRRNMCALRIGCTRYIGVRRGYKSRRWRSYARVNNKSISIGTHATALQAAIARDEYVVRQGLNRTLNFPELFRQGTAA